MNIETAIIETACFPAHQSELRARVIAGLVAGTVTICPDCGFFTAPGTECRACEDAWADEQAALEEEYAWGRCDMLAGRF